MMQLDLLETPQEAPKDHSLFLAVMPDRPAAEAILEHANSLRNGRGSLRPIHHLHVSLHGFGNFSEIPESIVSKVEQACAKVANKTAPCEIIFDRVMRYGGGSVVMTDTASANESLKEMHRALERELLLSGASKSISNSLSPHVTMLYDAPSIDDQAMRPFAWTAREIVLIDSWQGKTQYKILGRWALGGHLIPPV